MIYVIVFQYTCSNVYVFEIVIFVCLFAGRGRDTFQRCYRWLRNSVNNFRICMLYWYVPTDLEILLTGISRLNDCVQFLGSWCIFI